MGLYYLQGLSISNYNHTGKNWYYYIEKDVFRSRNFTKLFFYSGEASQIINETCQLYRWSARDRLILDSCLSLSTSDPLCLNPSPAVHIINNLTQNRIRSDRDRHFDFYPDWFWNFTVWTFVNFFSLKRKILIRMLTPGWSRNCQNSTRQLLSIQEAPDLCSSSTSLSKGIYKILCLPYIKKSENCFIILFFRADFFAPILAKDLSMWNDPRSSPQNIAQLATKST